MIDEKYARSVEKRALSGDLAAIKEMVEEFREYRKCVRWLLRQKDRADGSVDGVQMREFEWRVSSSLQPSSEIRSHVPASFGSYFANFTTEDLVVEEMDLDE